MKIELPGQRVELTTKDLGFGDLADELGAEIVGATRAAEGRRAAAADAFEVSEGDPSDVLELQWEDGIIELVRADEVARLYPEQGRAADAPVPFIPSRRTIGAGTRDQSEIILEGVKRIGLKIAEQAAGAAVPRVFRAIEDRRIPNPGLHRVGPTGALVERVEGVVPAAGPLLVLVHGTFSSTAGAFSDLFNSPDWSRLWDAHPDRVYALEQHTVTDSPALNAIQLAQHIPEGAKLRLLSHSRGGIVGDLLCRAPWTSEELAQFFSQDQYETVVGELEKLAMLCGRFEVERFSRVAAPTGGTLLASGRLDRWLSAFLTVLGKVLGPNAVWFEFAKAIATAIVSTRRRADQLPGLEAMVPHGDQGFVPFLNAAEPRGSDLAVIAGDVEGGRFFDRVKGFFVDLYYREDNDFVVDSKSMFRGTPRSVARGFYYRAPKADHFSYFSESETRGRIVDWLAEGDERRFRRLTAAEPYGGLRGAQPRRGITTRVDRDYLPSVYLLPGIMGSHLDVDGERHWISPLRLAWHGLDGLEIEAEGVRPERLVDLAYEKIFHRLELDYNVRPFAYDWRLPIRNSADRLAQAIGAELETHNRPIRILAHSMGGLVARTLIMNHRHLWEAMKKRGGRLVMLGTPNRGSYVPAQVLTRRHKLMKRLAMLAVRRDLAELTEIVRHYPGLLEMLPRGQRSNLVDPASWVHLEDYMPSRETLEAAKMFCEALDGQGADDGLVYVAGYDKHTPAQLEIKGDRVDFLYTGRGDGTVPWELGLIEGVDTYYIDAEHGQMPNHERSYEGFVELLAEGKTALLSMTPPVVARAEGEELVRWTDPLEDRAPYYPSADDLLATIMGEPGEERETVEPPIHVQILNADVREADHPVMVGHYQGDPILSAEYVLDVAHGGALSRLQRLGRYVGPVGTVRLHPSDGAGPDTVVVGLGEVGTLTRTQLEEVFVHGLLEVALDRIPRRGQPPVALTVSSVLIGTYGGTRLSIEDCIETLTTAARVVNAKLRKDALSERVWVAGIEIVELFQDIAIEAAQAALRVAERSEGAVEAAPTLRSRAGARRMRPRTPYKEGWVRRIRVSVNDANDLEYEVTTDLARVEPKVRPIQWNLVESLLKRSPLGDREAPRTLFRYLLPYELAQNTEDSPDLMLQLDPKSARIPWELLDSGRAELPLGVRVGLLRTLRSTDVRADPRRSEKRRALVIGEPAGEGLALPGARAEAEWVARLLHDRGIDVNPQIGKSGSECFMALYDGDYDIVHIAAHGAYDPDDPRGSGVVLGEGQFLGVGEFGNIAAVPSIVFLNCCHLGAIDRLAHPAEAAANVAQKLIEVGVKVVVAAGWAVGDRPAQIFASTLYEGLLDGRDLMSAVRLARRETHEVCRSSDVTWGAYQVYGDPGFRLPIEAVSHRGEFRIPRFVAPSELIDFLRDFGSRSRGPDSATRQAELMKSLGTLQHELPTRWFERGDVAAAMAGAYAELGDFAAAIEWYEKAIATSLAPLSAAEQLANLEARRAAELADQDPSDPRVGELFERSIARLDLLTALAPSAQRLALRGATLKRKVDCVSNDEDKLKLRHEALSIYDEAAKSSPRNEYHPLINKIQLQISLGEAPSKQDLIAVERSAARNIDDKWAPVTAADATLIRYAYFGEGSVESAIEAYVAALTGGSGLTSRERSSMLESVDRLIGAVQQEEVKARLLEVRTSATQPH